MDQQVGLYVSGMVQDSKKIVKDMISPVPSTLGIGLAYSCYFKPEMGISRVNEFQGIGGVWQPSAIQSRLRPEVD